MFFFDPFENVSLKNWQRGGDLHWRSIFFFFLSPQNRISSYSLLFSWRPSYKTTCSCTRNRILVSLNEIIQVHITYSADFFIWVDYLIFYLFYYSHFGGKIFLFTFEVGWIVCQSLSAEDFVLVLLLPTVQLPNLSVIHIPGADFLLLPKN